MKRLYTKLINLCPGARACLQTGLSVSALFLWMACLFLIRAGTLHSRNISLYLLAYELQQSSVGILMISVIAACFLEEHRST